MAIRHEILLSTTEPNNEIGLLKIRQADEQTQTLVVQITANALPRSFEGLQPFFCAKLGQTAGLGIIEQKLNPDELTDPENGKLAYTMRPEDWQQTGRQTAYFSFRKMSGEHEWTEQFSTRDFYYTVTKSVFSDGLREIKKDGSTYIWTIEDLIRLFNEYIATGQSDWEFFVNQNREVLESVDPGGSVLTELIDARKPNGKVPFQNLSERLDDNDEVTNNAQTYAILQNRVQTKKKTMSEFLGVHLWERENSLNFDDVEEQLKSVGMSIIRKGIAFGDIFGNSGGDTHPDPAHMLLDFSAHDDVVNEYLSRGFKVVIYIEKNNKPSIASNEQLTIDCYKNFIRQLVEHFKNKNIIFESLNEPMNGTWITNPPTSEIRKIEIFTELARFLGKMVSEIDPTGQCWVGTFSVGKDYVTEQDYYESYMPKMHHACRLGILDYADGLSIHPYQLSTPPESFANNKNRAYELCRLLVNEYSDREIDIVFSEMGYSDTNYGAGVNQIDRDTQANWETRAIILAHYIGVSTFIRFKYADSLTGENQEKGFGMIESDLKTSKLNHQMFKQILSPIKDMILAERIQTTAKDDYIFRYVDEKLLDSKLVYWTAGKVEHQILVDGKLLALANAPQIADALKYDATSDRAFNTIPYQKTATLFGSGEKVAAIPIFRDADDMLENGTYIVFTPSKWKNLPTQTKCYLVVELAYHTASSGDILQRCVVADDKKEYRRYKGYRGWSAWKRVGEYNEPVEKVYTSLANGATGTVSVREIKNIFYSEVDISIDITGCSGTGWKAILNGSIPYPYKGLIIFSASNPDGLASIKEFACVSGNLIMRPSSTNVSDKYRLQGSVSYRTLI